MICCYIGGRGCKIQKIILRMQAFPQSFGYTPFYRTARLTEGYSAAFVTRRAVGCRLRGGVYGTCVRHWNGQGGKVALVRFGGGCRIGPDG